MQKPVLDIWEPTLTANALNLSHGYGLLTSVYKPQSLS